MPKLKPWEERAPAAAGATPPQRTHESHSPRPQHLTGGGGGGAAAAQPPEGASKPPPPLLAAQTDAGAGAAAGRERGDTSHISPLFNGERAAERPTAAAARERRTQAATGGGAANPPRRARSLLRPDRAAICASGGKRADKAQRRGGRASECRAPRAHRESVARTATPPQPQRAPQRGHRPPSARASFTIGSADVNQQLQKAPEGA